MAGHSHWKQIKHQKGDADKKRSALFSKLLKAIQAAARTESNPNFNPRLKDTILKARSCNVPSENIERAIHKSSDKTAVLDELVLEAYGPAGAAFIIEAVTDNRNRTVAEVKKILSEHSAKLANPGSVLWSFEKQPDGWRAKFPQEVSEETRKEIKELMSALDDHDDVQSVISNAH